MRILQVSEFVEIVNGILRETMSGEVFAVEGEISGYRVSQGQWVTFDLKDERSLVNVFLPVWNVNVPLEDGLRVRVFGLPRIYPKYGKFSFSAERIEPAGEGALKKALAALRSRLEKEGLFEPSRKRPLPRFPRRIALIASRESAAYGDFVRIVGERWGGLDIDLYHVTVQGDRAAPEIAAAMAQAQAGDYDVLVMTRGGGSLEDLMAFNDERVARAIHASRIPTLVAIGHERDITLAEEAADVRGSTPTDCARRLVPDRKDVLYELLTVVEKIETGTHDEVDRGWLSWERIFTAPAAWLTARKSLTASLAARCVSSAEGWFWSLSRKLEQAIRLLVSYDPRQVLERGYAMLKVDGVCVKTIKALKVGQRVKAVFKDGQAGLDVAWVGQEKEQPKLL